MSLSVVESQAVVGWVAVSLAVAASVLNHLALNRYRNHCLSPNRYHSRNRLSSRDHAAFYTGKTDPKSMFHRRQELRQCMFRHWDPADMRLAYVQSFYRHTHNDHNRRNASRGVTPNQSRGARKDATPRRNTHVRAVCRGGMSGIHTSDLDLLDTTATCDHLLYRCNRNDYSHYTACVDGLGNHDHTGLYPVSDIDRVGTGQS